MSKAIAKTDDQNLDLAESIDSVDKLNAEFYKRFPYPWPPMKFECILDPSFETVMLNQTIGDWDNRVLPKKPKIWVAGCGTNLAVYTALRFPEASVVGSDLSTKSLEVCADTARQVGASNLELREESINQIAYKEEFDYIICTGVIHHNADPKATLNNLVVALKPTGILELMVYNLYHFIVPAAVQKAVRILGGDGSATSMNLEAELAVAKKLIDKFPLDNLVAKFLVRFKDSPEARLADEALQPVLYSYTVESLDALAAECNLELLAPYISLFDKTDGRISWNMEFDDPDLQHHYDSLADVRRWQVANLLMFEKSPLLWFYLQRKDSGRQRKSEKQMCAEFLSTKFVRTDTKQRSYILRGDSTYKLSPNALPYPLAAPDASVKKIVDSVDGQNSMREIFARLEIEPTFQAINQARIKLTTSAFPYLRSIQSSEHENHDAIEPVICVR